MFTREKFRPNRTAKDRLQLIRRTFTCAIYNATNTLKKLVFTQSSSYLFTFSIFVVRKQLVLILFEENGRKIEKTYVALASRARNLLA